MWQRDTTVGCPDEDEDSHTTTDTSYEITGLEADSSYIITVRAMNDAGSGTVSNTVTTMTLEAGERELLQVHISSDSIYNVHVYTCIWFIRGVYT